VKVSFSNPFSSSYAINKMKIFKSSENACNKRFSKKKYKMHKFNIAAQRQHAKGRRKEKSSSAYNENMHTQKISSFHSSAEFFLLIFLMNAFAMTRLFECTET
jgi:hypothetical protein